MPRVTGHNAVTVGIVTLISIYMGVNFFQPIVVERLRNDGHLRQDIDVPNFNPDGSLQDPKEPVDPANKAEMEE